ncbi:MAG: hypothetical protein M9918_12615 [Anaerolineae bacterium]|nr:hypothetical protein [Anaerolineae bacterium]
MAATFFREKTAISTRADKRSTDLLTTATALGFRTWLTANRSRATVTTYTAAVLGYLDYLDGLDVIGKCEFE